MIPNMQLICNASYLHTCMKHQRKWRHLQGENELLNQLIFDTGENGFTNVYRLYNKCICTCISL